MKSSNTLSGATVKLGSWPHLPAMRSSIVELNARCRDLLSNDLGAVAGLLFDIGGRRYAAPPLGDDAKALAAGRESDRTHSEEQGWLRDLGTALGFDAWIVANDRARAAPADGRTAAWKRYCRALPTPQAPRQCG